MDFDTKWITVERKSFTDEMEAEIWMINNCLENGFYRLENNLYVVYESIPDMED